MLLEALWKNRVEAAAIILFGIGFTTLLLNRNLIRKIIGFSFMDSAIFLFLTSGGYIAGNTAPIQDSASSVPPSSMVNPVPAGLVLTGIVVSVSVTALMLSLTVRLWHRYHTLDFDEICRIYHAEAHLESEETVPSSGVQGKNISQASGRTQRDTPGRKGES